MLLSAFLVAWGAEAAQFLISQGVRSDLLSAKGFGDADPIASNDTPAGRAQNRRVELSLAGPDAPSPNYAPPSGPYPPPRELPRPGDGKTDE
jgi:hypothetical protein